MQGRNSVFMKQFPANKVSASICAEMQDDYLWYCSKKTKVHVEELKHYACKPSLWEQSALTVMKLRMFQQMLHDKQFDPVAEMLHIIELCETISIMRINGDRIIPPVLNGVQPCHHDDVMYKDRSTFVSNICAYAVYAKLPDSYVPHLCSILTNVLPKTLDHRMIHEINQHVCSALYQCARELPNDRYLIVTFALCEFVNLSLDPKNNIY